MQSFEPALPEMILLLAGCLVLVVDAYWPGEKQLAAFRLTQLSLLLALAATLWSAAPDPQILFFGHYVRDAAGDIMKTSVLLISCFVFLYSRDFLRINGLHKSEFYVLALFAVLGINIIVSSATFLTLYLGLELLSLALYTLVALDRDSKLSAEAAMKFFVLGAMASGFLLYGISIVYGVTGTLEFSVASNVVLHSAADQKILVFGLVFLVLGLAFKFGAAPFHMWMPDVYHGAPVPVALFTASVPKIAAFALALRILVDAMPGTHADWQGMLAVLAVLSMGLGNVVAIAQTNIRRMFAYSTISHVGFILLGILSGTPGGLTGSLFYALVYAVMASGGFAVVLILSRAGFIAEQLDDLKGLAKRDAWYALMMMLIMFSMAGVPPMVGFLAKWLVLQAVVDAGMLWLALVGVVFSIVGAFYYLRIIKLMYFDDPVDFSPLCTSTDVKVAFSINGLAVLYLGLFPSSILVLCANAFN